MSDFMSGLTELLGGFSAKRQIDKDGFDWREKRQADQFARDQEREDWATKAATEAALGTEDDAEVASTIPGDVDRARVMARTRGAGLQSKSSLEAMRAATAASLLDQRGRQGLGLVEARGGVASDLLAQRAALEADREMSPRDKAMNLADLDRAIAVAKARGTGAQRPRNPYRSPATTNEAGEPGTYMINPGTGEREWFPSAPTVTQRDTTGMAGAIRDSLDVMEEAAKTGVTTGPIAGRLSKIWQQAYPSGAEGEFDSAANRLVDIVYLKSGKQINANEMKILTTLIPNRAKGNIEFQIKQFEDYADSLLSRYPQRPAGGGARTVTSKEERDRLPSGAEYIYQGKTYRKK